MEGEVKEETERRHGGEIRGKWRTLGEELHGKGNRTRKADKVGNSDLVKKADGPFFQGRFRDRERERVKEMK